MYVEYQGGMNMFVECQECYKNFNEDETHNCPNRDCFAEYICKDCFEEHVKKCSKLFKER